MRCDLQDRASVARLRHGESDVHPFLVALVEYYGVRTFVETGTQQGNTVEALRRHVERVYSIEIDDECFNRCRERFDGVDNVELVRGSSHEELDWLLHKSLPEPILFWLDAHAPDQPDQVPAELRAIEFYYPNSLVVIDDVAKPAGTAPGYYVVDRRFSFWPPKDWQCLHVAHMDLMILHRGSYRCVDQLFDGLKMVSFGVHLETHPNQEGEVALDPHGGAPFFFSKPFNYFGLRWATDLLPEEIAAHRPTSCLNQLLLAKENILLS